MTFVFAFASMTMLYSVSSECRCAELDLSCSRSILHHQLDSHSRTTIIMSLLKHPYWQCYHVVVVPDGREGEPNHILHCSIYGECTRGCPSRSNPCPMSCISSSSPICLCDTPSPISEWCFQQVFSPCKLPALKHDRFQFLFRFPARHEREWIHQYQNRGSPLDATSSYLDEQVDECDYDNPPSVLIPMLLVLSVSLDVLKYMRCSLIIRCV